MAPKQTRSKSSGKSKKPSKVARNVVRAKAAKNVVRGKGPAKKLASRAAKAKNVVRARAVAKKPAAAKKPAPKSKPVARPRVTVSRPPSTAPRSLDQPPALGDDEVEVSGVYGRIRYNESDPLAEVKEIFDHYDRDKSGNIEAKEFARILEALGMELEEHELKVAILDVDHDGDGRIGWGEFSEWWRAMRS